MSPAIRPSVLIRTGTSPYEELVIASNQKSQSCTLKLCPETIVERAILACQRATHRHEERAASDPMAVDD